MKNPLKIVCYGEILWDLFPDGKMLGGAPLNVALRLHSLGNKVQMVSRLGEDSLSRETLELLNKHKLNTDLIQHDPKLATGSVDVKLDQQGSASYTIKKPVAWDAIALTEQNQQAVSQADLFVHGSLAARSAISKNTLFELLKRAKKPVFDVNLRTPHYELQEVVALMEHAHLIKMNDDELQEICGYLGLENQDQKHKIKALGQSINAAYICVTRGSHGALLLDGDKLYSHPGFPAKVVDTVGAGDSFLAGLLHILFRESDAQKALAYGCALGSLVASQKGANSEIPEQQLNDLIG